MDAHILRPEPTLEVRNNCRAYSVGLQFMNQLVLIIPAPIRFDGTVDPKSRFDVDVARRCEIDELVFRRTGVVVDVIGFIVYSEASVTFENVSRGNKVGLEQIEERALNVNICLPDELELSARFPRQI